MTHNLEDSFFDGIADGILVCLFKRRACFTCVRFFSLNLPAFRGIPNERWPFRSSKGSESYFESQALAVAMLNMLVPKVNGEFLTQIIDVEPLQRSEALQF